MTFLLKKNRVNFAVLSLQTKHERHSVFRPIIVNIQILITHISAKNNIEGGYTIRNQKAEFVFFGLTTASHLYLV